MRTIGGLRRSWVLLAFVLAAALVVSQTHGLSAGAQGPPDHVPDHVHDLLERTGKGETVRVIVKLQSQADQNPVAAQARAQGARVIHQYNNFSMLALEVNENALRGLLRSPRVVSVIEDGYDAPALDDSLPVINADTVHELGWDGDGYTVAILDTGIDRNHPFVAGRVVEEYCFSDPGDDENRLSLCPNGETTQSGVGAADSETENCWAGTRNICDHGPHVAGISAGDGTADDNPDAPRAGVAPGANIIAIQVFHRVETACGFAAAPCVLSAWSDQIAGLDTVLDLADSYSIVAANMSLGGGQFSEICDDEPQEGGRKEPMDKLRDEGIATIVASGNNGFTNAIGAPACISTAIAVGATTNDDVETRNRGPLLDLFAPGVGIVSSIDTAGGYGSKSGTSMAAPHVAGAWAVLRQAYPDLTLDATLELLQDTGVPITYPSGGEDVTTPRIDLLAALQADSQAPTLTVDDDPVTVEEGQIAENSGTFDAHGEGPVAINASIGEVETTQAAGTWFWSFQTVDGPDDSDTVTITATNNKGVETEVLFELEVLNVAPTVTIDPAQVTTISEGQTLTVNASFTDPGILDEPFTATITCYDIAAFGTLTVPGTVSVSGINAGTGLLEGTVTGDCTYGDTSQSGDPPSGTFTVTVTVTDKDGDSGNDSFELTVLNVDPTVEIDRSNTVDVNGTPTFIAQVGETIDFSADITDPGSDDIFLVWDWGDGTDDDATYLNNPPNPDPFPSPDVNPRDITDTQSHSWTSACLWLVTLTATDDDDGAGTDEVAVVITGDADAARSAGYWLHQYRGRGQSDFDTDTLECYLDIVGHMSQVFHDPTDASTLPQAAQVLHLAGNSGDMEQIFDRQLLAAWLNFANGAIALDELVDTTGDGIGDTEFFDVLQAAESVRLDPDATDAELEAQKDILERINLMHGG